MTTYSKTPCINDREIFLQAFDLLRFPLAVLVVVEHIFPPYFNTPLVDPAKLPFDVYNSPILNLLRNFIDTFIRGHNVPIFFFISGFLFFLSGGGEKFSREVYLRKIKSRFHTLFIPYVIWNMIALIPLLLFHLSDFNFNLKGLLSIFFRYDHSLILSPTTTYYTMRLQPINSPLWYIFDLMVVVLFTPIIYKLLTKMKYCFIIILGCLWFTSVFYEPLADLGFATAFFFFSCGACMSIWKKDIENIFGRLFRFSMVAYPCVGLFSMSLSSCYPQVAMILNHLNIILGLLFAYNLAIWLLRKKNCRVDTFLASSSMFIYVSHYFLYSRYNGIYRKIAPIPEIQMIALYCFAVIFTVLALLGVYKFMKRYMPLLLRIMIGR